jgi:uncharacterized linocin/CFP29 family protein
MREEEFIYHGRPDFHLQGLLTAEGRNKLQGGDWGSVDQVLDNVIAAVNALDGKGYRGPYGLALAPALYNNLFRRYPGSDRAAPSAPYTRIAAKSRVVLVADVGSIVLGQDLQIAYLTLMQLTKLCRHRVTGS